MDKDPFAALEQGSQFREERRFEKTEIVFGDGAMAPGDTQLVVVVEIEGSRDRRDDTGESLFADPDDFLLAANLSMVRSIATGSLTEGESLSDHPMKVAGSDPLRPFPFTGHGVHAATTLAAWMALLTS